MREGQLDLFSDWVRESSPRPHQPEKAPRLDAEALTDAALVDAIPLASLAECRPLAEEAARRRLTEAVPALEALCRRFTGFGAGRLVPEQAAALEALSTIGGAEAARAVGRLVVRQAVEGPTLVIAVAAAARLGVVFPPATAQTLLGHADPLIRANACRCARSHSSALPALVDLLADPSALVRIAAACALGRMGRLEARPLLTRLLRDAPSAEVIDATPAIADEACCVLLGRIARSGSALARLALDALHAIDDPRAERIVAGVDRAATEG